MVAKVYEEFCSKKELLNWIENHIDEIDFYQDVARLEFYPNEY